MTAVPVLAAGAVTIAPLPRDLIHEVADLRLPPELEPFSGRIADLVADDDPQRDFHKVVAGGEVVGFFKIERGHARLHNFASGDDLGLRAVQIDGRHHGKGYGKAMFAALPAYLAAHYPGHRRIWLTVNLRNPGARHVYLSGGWIDTGDHYLGGSLGPQHIMYLDLGGAPAA